MNEALVHSKCFFLSITHVDQDWRGGVDQINMVSIDWEVIVAELSGGMAQLLDREEGRHGGQICPKSLRLGLSRLAAAMIRAGTSPIVSIPDAVEMMQKPLGMWEVSPPPPEYMKDLTLMDGEYITEDAEDWIVDNPDVAAELTQRIMKRVIDKCRERDDQDGYVTFRRFIIERPVATRSEWIQALDNLKHADLVALLHEAYENVPYSLSLGDDVPTCEKCGWTLRKEVNRDVWRCATRQCSQLEHFLPAQYPQSRPWSSGLRRVRAGLARFTSRPGELELRVYRSLSNLELLQVELWPHYDAYDIGITFPDGAVWAVDCKDWKNPGRLAARLRKSDFPRSDSWQRAFYVFPSYRRKLMREYGRRFESGWQQDAQDVSWSYDDRFVEKVKRQVSQDA